jgi:hypothetical protein
MESQARPGEETAARNARIPRRFGAFDGTPALRFSPVRGAFYPRGGTIMPHSTVARATAAHPFRSQYRLCWIKDFAHAD